MTKETEIAYNAMIKALDRESAKLGRADYIDLIYELSAHFKCLTACIEEETGEP
jgi:hypothetical protein